MVMPPYITVINGFPFEIDWQASVGYLAGALVQYGGLCIRNKNAGRLR